MNTQNSIGSGALIAALLTSTASFADVTPDQVWDNWRGYLESFGYAVTATENMSGSTLSISDLSMDITLPNDEGTVGITMGEVSFADQGDGTVLVSLPPLLPIGVNVMPTSGENVELGIDYATTEFSMIASGTIDDLTYTYSASALSMSLAKLVVDGTAMDNASAVIAIGNVSGNTVIKTTDMRSVAQTINAADMQYDVNIAEPGGDGSLVISGQTADLHASSNVTMPLEMDTTDFAMALGAGLDASGAISTGAGNAAFNFVDGGDTAAGNSASTGTSLSFVMNADRLGYGLSTTGVTYHVAGSEIPFPVNVAADEIAFDFSMPVGQSETPGDFALLTKVAGFAPDAMIWGLLDPTGALPHDPATLVIDIAGKINWLIDIMDPAQAAMMGDGTMPAELHAVTLNELTVSAAGAMLTGTGDFTFNPDDLTTFDGMPAPDGAVDLKIVGANGLLDNLIGMGLVSDDDAMGARMMMGLFGRPGEGEDTVLSTIEVKSDGQILANGQRLQ